MAITALVITILLGIINLGMFVVTLVEAIRERSLYMLVLATLSACLMWCIVSAAMGAVSML